MTAFAFQASAKTSSERSCISRRSDREYLADIHEAIQRIQTYTAALSYAEFLADEKTQDAVIRNVEILGVESLVQDAERRGRVLGVQLPPEDGEGDEPWKTPSSLRRLGIA